MLRSSELLSCQDYRVANLIMVHLPERLIKFYQTSQTSDTSISKEQAHLNPAEYGPLTYVAGYVIAKLYQVTRNKKTKTNQELQSLLQSLKSSEPSDYISARTSGGLVTPCKDLVNILEIAEMCFREHVDNSEVVVRNIPQ